MKEQYPSKVFVRHSNPSGEKPMSSLLQNIVGCLALGLAVGLVGAQDAAPVPQDARSVPQKRGEAPKGDSTPSAGNGTRPALDATDKTSGASVPAEEPAKSTAAARQETNPVADDGEEVKIFRLKRADATASRDLVLEMYPADFKSRSKIAADARTNTLVVRGPGALLNLIEAVLLNLDESETAKRPEEKGARDPQNRFPAAGKAAQSRRAGARDNGVAELQTAADPNTDVARINHEFRRREQQAAEMARRYRQAQTAASPNDTDLQKFRAALEHAVRAAFDARQKALRDELDELRERLARIEARLANRDREAEEIVRQRVEQLLHPERDWEPGGDVPAKADPLSDEPRSSRSNRAAKNPLGSGMGSMGGAVKKPRRGSVDDVAGDLGRVERVPSSADPDHPGKSFNLRTEMLEAEFALSAARNGVDADEKNCKSVQTEFERVREHFRNGAVPEKLMREAERNVEISAERLKKAKLVLERAEAKVSLARENLEAQRKLLELDLQNAKLRIAHLTNDESRARRLIESKAVSQAEYEEKKLALEQAKLELDRIAEQIELYSKPIPGIGRATPDDERPKQPAPEEKNEKPDADGTREKLR
jgi:hypothetical protein